MKALDAIAREVRALRKSLDKMREEYRAVVEQLPPRDGAVKRAVAAKLCGISVSKLDALIRDGKIRTTEDSRLVPMSEVRRFTAPKQKRQRKPAIGHRARMKNLDAQSDEAWNLVDVRVRATGKAAP